jgi:hypothetical protein
MQCISDLTFCVNEGKTIINRIKYSFLVPEVGVGAA